MPVVEAALRAEAELVVAVLRRRDRAAQGDRAVDVDRQRRVVVDGGDVPPAVHRGRDRSREGGAAVAAGLQRRGVRERNLPFRRGAVGAADCQAREPAAVDRVGHLHPARQREVAAEVEKIGIVHDEHRAPGALVPDGGVEPPLAEDALARDGIRRAASVRRGRQPVARGVGDVALRLGHVPDADVVGRPRAECPDLVGWRAPVVHRERRPPRERGDLDPDEGDAVRVPFLDVAVQRPARGVGEAQLAPARRVDEVRVAEPFGRILGEANGDREVRESRLSRVAGNRERNRAREAIDLDVLRLDDDGVAGLALADAAQHRHADRRVDMPLLAVGRNVGGRERG